MRLIDADALKDLIVENVYPLRDFILNSSDYGMFWTGGIEKAIDEQPTIDAVPVVRCRDCEWWYSEVDDEYGHCRKHDFWTFGGWFCADGEGVEE